MLLHGSGPAWPWPGVSAVTLIRKLFLYGLLTQDAAGLGLPCPASGPPVGPLGDEEIELRLEVRDIEWGPAGAGRRAEGWGLLEPGWNHWNVGLAGGRGEAPGQGEDV